MKQSKKTARRKKNPAVFRFRAQAATQGRRAHRRRRNPATAGVLRSGKAMFKTGLMALLGLLVARQLPQAVLKDKNTGVIGYLSNVVTALVASAAVTKAIGKAEGQAVGIGGALYVMNRIIAEQFSPIGKMLSLSGIGDAQANGSMGLGAVVPRYSPVPVAYQATKPVYNPHLLAAAREGMQPAQPAAPATVSGVGRAWRRGF